MSTDDLGLLNGTLDLLVLRALAWGPRHGFSVAYSRECARASLHMLRFKRAVMQLSPEGLASYGIVNLDERDKHEGWTTRLSQYDLDFIAGPGLPGFFRRTH